MNGLKCPVCRAIIWKQSNRAKMHVNCPECAAHLRLLHTWPRGNFVLTERVFKSDWKGAR